MRYLLTTALLSSWLVADMENFHINGFGTLGLTYQNNDTIIYTSSWRCDKGTQGDLSLANDTKFGLQFDWQANEKIDFTLQGSIDAQGANLDWANFKYRFNDTHSFKIGQMRFPTAMYSDILKISYSYNWVRLPSDLYGILPLTSYRGGEYNYQGSYKESEYHFKLYGGSAEDTMIGSQDIGDYTISLKHIYGANFSVTLEHLLLRIGYTHTDISIQNEKINRYFDMAFASSTLSSEKKALLHHYDPRNKATQYLSFGMKYTYDNFYLLGEYTWMNMNNIISDNYAGYLSAGYHIDTWTPHLTFSKVTGKSNYTQSVQDSQIDQALQEMSTRTLTSQETITLGLRYDWRENIALKIQYDHIKEGKKGRGISIHTVTPYEPTTIHLLSFSMDFIF